MYICPNKNLQEWKNLVAKVGSEDKAWAYFIKNNFEVPTQKEIDQISEPPTPNLTKIKKFLGNSDFFSRTESHPSGIKIKNKNLYPQAASIVGRINAQYPGLLSIVTVKNFSSQINYVKINEGQQDLFKNYYYDIPERKEIEDNKIDYRLKAANILTSDKATEWFKKRDKAQWKDELFWNKLQQDLQIPKEQIEILKSLNTQNPYNREELLTSLLADYSYTIEVNTATTRRDKLSYYNYQAAEDFTEAKRLEAEGWEYDGKSEDGEPLYKKPKSEHELDISKTRNTDYYSNLAVSGGTNYTENEITTPAITPSIKGHAQFSTNNGIGWFRSDEEGKNKVPGFWVVKNGIRQGFFFTRKEAEDNIDTHSKNFKSSKNEYKIEEQESETFKEGSKTRRILEIQSDLFQKGRDIKDLISGEDTGGGMALVYPRPSNSQQNNFLQLLNKNNNWVTFFIKSIIQDSAKKGYEKVLFPTGNTASKVEGHETLEEFKREKEQRLSDLQHALTESTKAIATQNFTVYSESKNLQIITNSKREIEQVKEELQRVEKEGFAALRPIYKFYEETVQNILKKLYNIENIKDNYGNTWIQVIPEKNQIYLDLPESDYKSLLLKGFEDFNQQKEVIDVISSHVLTYLKENKARFKQAFDDFYSTLEEVEKEQPKAIYTPIKENKDELYSQVFDRLANKLELISKPVLKGVSTEPTPLGRDEEDDQNYAPETNEDTKTWRDSWVFQYNGKTNALEEVRRFLAFIPKTTFNPDTNEFEIAESVIPSQPVYLSYDEVYEQLKAILAGTQNTWEAMESQLRNFEKSKPFIHTLLDQVNYSEDKERLKNQFVSTMSGVYSGFKTILVKDKLTFDPTIGQYITTGTYFNIIDTDQSSIEKVILSKWQGEFKRSKLYESKDGKYIPNKKEVQSYLAQIKEGQKNPTKENIKQLLTNIGIEVIDSTLNELVEGKINKLSIQQQFISKSGLFTLIENRLKGQVSADDIEQTDEEQLPNDPLVNNSAIKALAREEARNSDYYFSNTFKDGEGNTVYSYSFNKFLTKEFNKLKTDSSYAKSLLSVPFNKTLDLDGKPVLNTWLNLLSEDNQSFKEIFNISPFDTIKVIKEDAEGTKLPQMSKLDLELTKIALIQNSGQRKRGIGSNANGERVINYLLTIPSKTTSYVIKGTGHELKLYFNQTGFTIDGRTLDALYSIAASEHNRILSQGGKGQFYFFPTLNQIVFNQNGEALSPVEKIGAKSVETLIREEVKKIIISNIDSKRAEWEQLGILKNGELQQVDINYQDSILTQQSASRVDQANFAVADYVIQSMIGKFNTHQAFIDDPVVYHKKNIESTWDNVGKRLTNLIAPFKDGNINDTNRYYKSIKLVDRETAALNRAQVVSRLKSLYNEEENPYTKIDGTDAQEYTTITEELKTAYAYGEISTEFYEKTLKRIKSEGDNLILSKQEIETLLVPRKPVYSDRQIVGNEIKRNYVKSASFVLAPQLTKGLELDKLRKAMEKLEEKNISVRAPFESATKLSSINKAINIWNEDGTIKDDLDLTSAAVILDRSNFGIQQEVPYDEKKDEILRSTQVLKLLFNELDNIEGFRYQNKSYKGEELAKQYNDIWKQLYERSLTSLQDELTEDNKFISKKLVKLLNEEGQKRGYTYAQLSYLTDNQDKTDFAIPFWGHVNNDKEQSMITSLWTNRILKQKLNGSSYVLVSEEGTKGLSEGILYTKEYDPSVGLKPQRIAYKKDAKAIEQDEYDLLSKEEREGYREIVKPAQVIISWNLRGKTGKLLNRKDYTIKDEAGKEFLDLNKVPREILTQFGFRIPNQGHNSMGLIEIVGFLPDIYAGTVIASRNFITQMGSDFDVDKLYIYEYSLYDNADGKLERDKKDIRNNLLDIHKSVMYNPRIFNKIIKPLDEGKNKEIAEEIKKLTPTKTLNYLNPDFDRDKYLQSTDGKIMVGLTSVGNTMNTLMQNKGITLQKKVAKGYESDYITWKDRNGKVHNLTDLSSEQTIYGRSKNEIHQAIQSTAVDNEKDPKLDYLNATAETYSVVNLMMKLGLEEPDIYLFTAQPILKTYTERVKQANSSLSLEFTKVSEIALNLQDNKVREAIYLKTGYENIEDYPLSENDLRKALYKDQANNPYKSQFTPEEVQQLVLAKFSKLQSYGDILNRAQNILNIESKGIGKSILELDAKADSIEGVLSNPLFKNLHKVVGEQNQDAIEPNTVNGYGIFNSVYPAQKVICNSKLMPFANPLFRELVADYENTTQRDSNADTKYELWKAIKAYNFSKIVDRATKLKIFFDKIDSPSLNTRITNLRKTKLKHNPFILRLDLSNVDLSGKNPSLVLYNSAKEEDIEETNIYQGLVDLVYHKDQDVREIGRDLIYYYFLNGGSSNSKDYGRYIDANMLETLGISNFIRNVSFNDPESYGYGGTWSSDIIAQLFQHKSYLAPTAKSIVQKDKALQIDYTKADKLFIPYGIVYDGLQPKDIQVVRVGNTLYKMEPHKADSKGYTYSILSSKAAKFYTDYNAHESIVNQGYDRKEKLSNPSIPENPVTISKNEWNNPLIAQEFEDLVDTDLRSALENISTSKYYKKLADLFSELQGIIGNVEIKAVAEDGYFAGRWNHNDISINLKALKATNKLTREYVERTILKEVVHVLHSKLFKSSFKASDSQLYAKQAIVDLYNTVRNQVLNSETNLWDKDTLTQYEEILTRNRANKTLNSANISESDKKFLTDHKDLYYGLTNVEDFLHEALLQEGFMKNLNQLHYDVDKSFIDRLYDIIKTILNEFASLVNVQQGSALEASINNLIRLTKEDIIPPQEIDSEEVFYDLVDTLNEDKKKYSKIVENYESRYRAISSSISGAENAGNKELKTELINRLKDIKEEQGKLIAENSIDTVITLANKDLSDIDQLLKKEDLNENDLRYINLVLGTWTSINNSVIYDVLSSKDIITNSEDAQKIDDIVAKANRLKNRTDEAQKIIIHTQAEQVLKREIKLEEITQVKDISAAQATFRDISSSDNAVLHTLDYWIRKQDFATTTELSETISELDKHTHELNQKGIRTREDFSRIFGQVMYQKQRDGSYEQTLTGELVDALSAEYFATRDNLKQAIENAPDPKFKQQAADKYYSWIVDNHIIVDYDALYTKDENGFLQPKNNQAYLDKLKKQAGKDFDLLYNNAKDKIAEYNEELSFQIKALNGNAESTKKLEVWQLENSPLIYLDNIKNGLTIRKVDGNIIYNQGWKYISKRAKQQWEDEKYNEIYKEGNEHLRNYYEFYRNTMKQLNNYLPYHIRQELKATDIPNVEKTLINEMYDSGIAKYANRTWSALLEEISVSKNEVKGTTDPVTGQFTKEFQFAYLNPINPQDKSYDLSRVLKLFAAQAIGYKHKAQIEDKVRLAESVLKSALEKQYRADGTPDTDKFGKTTTAKGLKNLQEQLDYVIDTFYGNKHNTKEGKTGKHYITPRDKERLQRDLEELKEKGLSEDAYNAAAQKLTDRYTRAFSFSRLGDTLLQYVQLKGMGWNIFGGMNNIIFGQIANYNWAASGNDFSDEDISKAVWMMLTDSNLPDDKPSKIRTLMTKFNTVKQLRDRVYSATTNYNKARKGLEKLLPYELYAKGEYFVQGQVMIAALNHQKVEVTENGEKKTIPLFEAFNDEGNWDTTRFGENKDWDKLGDKTLDFKLKLDTLLKKIHGNYDPNSAMKINKEFFGRAMIQFRRWIPEGVAQRFDSQKYDNYLQRTTKGRYRTFYDLGVKKSLSTLFKTAIYRGADKAFDDLGLEGQDLEIAKENMKKNLREIYFKLSLMLLYTMLSHLDEDDPWATAGKNYTMNTMLRLQDDIEFYFSPIAADNIVRTPLPVFNLISDFYKVGDALIETVEGNGNYKNGVHSGDSKLYWKTIRLLPGGAAGAALLNKTTNVETFRK